MSHAVPHWVPNAVPRCSLHPLLCSWPGTNPRAAGGVGKWMRLGVAGPGGTAGTEGLGPDNPRVPSGPQGRCLVSCRRRDGRWDAPALPSGHRGHRAPHGHQGASTPTRGHSPSLGGWQRSLKRRGTAGSAARRVPARMTRTCGSFRGLKIQAPRGTFVPLPSTTPQSIAPPVPRAPAPRGARPRAGAPRLPVPSRGVPSSPRAAAWVAWATRRCLASLLAEGQ